MATPTQLRLTIVCESPPPSAYEGQPTEFGLQDKQQVLHPGVERADGALAFSCDVSVKANPKIGAPDFGGSFVHGPVAGRFLYLGWRPLGGEWIRRFKIPLASITWQQIDVGRLAARISAARSGTVALLGAGWLASDGQ